MPYPKLSVSDLNTIKGILADPPLNEVGAIEHQVACAAISALVYKGEGRFGSSDWPTAVWDTLASSNSSNGYDAVAMVHRKTKTLVIANRGAEGFKSLTDWEQIFSMMGGKAAHKQIETAIDFFLATVRSHVAGCDRVLVTGHSLGAGLAEAQIRLALSEADAAVPALRNMPVAMVGFATASFELAIRALAAESLTDNNGHRANLTLTHFVRSEDVVNRQKRRQIAGDIIRPASVFTARPSTIKNGKYPGQQTWSPAGEDFESHSITNYVSWLTIPETLPDGSSQHVFKLVGNNPRFELRPGNSPEHYVKIALPSRDSV